MAAVPATLLITEPLIRRAITMRDAMRAVEAAFRAHGQGHVVMPSKVYLSLKRFGGDLRAMPVYLPSLHLCGMKWVNAHPDNRRYGLPAVMALIILNDPRTGFPVAVLDGTYLTQLRTGAGGGVAIKYLAGPARKGGVIALVGCGAQARTQLAAALEVLRPREIRVWGRWPREARQFCRSYHGRVRGAILWPVGTVRQCADGADIIITTTPSRRPLIRRAWVKPGAHINAIGADAPGKQELDPAILRHARVIVDDWAQAAHGGEINVPLKRGQITRRHIAGTLGQVVAKRVRGRRSAGEITVFDSTGVALQDLAVAKVVLDRAGSRARTIRWRAS